MGPDWLRRGWGLLDSVHILLFLFGILLFFLYFGDFFNATDSRGGCAYLGSTLSLSLKYGSQQSALRYESSTLILYKELSSSIFQM